MPLKLIFANNRSLKPSGNPVPLSPCLSSCSGHGPLLVLVIWDIPNRTLFPVGNPSMQDSTTVSLIWHYCEGLVASLALYTPEIPRQVPSI